MPSLLPNDIIKEIRDRIRITRMALHDIISLSCMEENEILSQLTIFRVEAGQQSIRVDNFSAVMDALKMPLDTLFCPCLEEQTVERLQLYDTLTHCMLYAKEDNTFRQKGLDLLKQLSNDPAFSQSINRQLLISQEVVLLEAMGKDFMEIRQLIYEGLEITYPELVQNPLIGDVLIFEEAPLLHSLARAYMQQGDTPQAIALLRNIFDGVTLLPQDNRDKERMLAPMLLTLAQCHIQENDYNEALSVCETGRKIAVKRNNGFYAPDFVELKVHCLYQLGTEDELPQLTLQALAGYQLLRRYNKADNLLQYANNHKITLNTYGMETIRPPMPEPNFAYGKTIACGSIGQLIGGLRYDADLKLRELCDGICTESALQKIESARLPLDRVYKLEAIMQRLGRHIDHYFHTFLSIPDFENKQKRDEINSLLINLKYEEAKELVDELEVNKRFMKESVNRQFIELAKVSISSGIGGYKPEHEAMLQDVLNITRKNKDFDISRVASTRMMYKEITAVNQMAICLCSTGNMRKGLRLYEDLIESMDKFYVDEHEKIRMYTMILRNYSTFLGREVRHKESIEFASTGEDMDVKHNRLNGLPTFAVNKACSMLDLGDKVNCLPYFALGYWGSKLVGRQRNAKITKKHVEERMGVSF